MLTEPQPIPVGQEPPPLRPTSRNGRPPAPARDPGHQGEAKGKPACRKTAGRFAVLNAFVDLTAGGLTRSEILVWLLLYRDTRDGTARTSQTDLARRGRLGKRTVGLAVRKLERKGLLRIVYRGGLNRGPSRYAVLPLERNRGLAQPIAP